MAIRILHVADLHLGWTPHHLGVLAEERCQERNKVLETVTEYAVDSRHGIHMVIIAGDLFEIHTPPEELVTYVIRQLERICHAGIILITVPGNHDEITYRESVYKVWEDRWPGILITNPMPQHVMTFQCQGEECHLYSMAYTGGLTKASSPLALPRRISKKGLHIGAFHGTVASTGWNLRERSLPLDPHSIRECGYNYIAMGHIHKRNLEQVGSSQLIYPGMIEGKTFSDPGGAPLLVATIDDRGTRLQDVPIKIRPIRRMEIDLTSFASQGELEEFLKTPGDSRAIQRMELGGILNFHLDRDDLIEKLAGYYYHLEVRDEAFLFSEELLKHNMKEPTLKGIFVRKMKDAISASSDHGEKARLKKALFYGLAAMDPSI
jgi:exonuclease SbcD